MKKTLTTTLKDIISVSISMNKIYQNITAAKIANNEDEIKKQLDYIKLVSEYETKLYQQLDLETELSEELYTRVELLIKCSKANKDIHELINTRFQSRINELCLLNPFLSTNDNLEERELENTAAIKFQLERDFLISNLYFLNKDIEKEKNPTIREELIKRYYHLIFTNRLLEPYLLEGPHNIEIDGRNRCLIFNQNEILVNEIFRETIIEFLNISINEIMKYTDEFIEKHPDKLANKKIQLTLMKASLVLATEEEKKTIQINASPVAKKISTKSLRDINYGIEEANLTVQEKAIQKKKS